MSVTERPTIRFLSIEILTATGGFILGRSLLDVEDLGSGDDELVWIPYTSAATQIGSQRGGKRSGVVNSMDVGTLNVTLKDAGDPLSVPDMRPNTPIRLMSAVIDRPLFTGTISDIDQRFAIDKRTGRVTTYTVISAVDAVQAHVNTTRYGAIAAGGFELWEERISRLAQSATTDVYVPPVGAPIVRYAL